MVPTLISFVPTQIFEGSHRHIIGSHAYSSKQSIPSKFIKCAQKPAVVGEFLTPHRMGSEEPRSGFKGSPHGWRRHSPKKLLRICSTGRGKGCKSLAPSIYTIRRSTVLRDLHKAIYTPGSPSADLGEAKLRFVGASAAAVLMLLALMLAGSMLAPKAVSTTVIADRVSANVDGDVCAGYFHIPAERFLRVEFYASRGTNVKIHIDIIPGICVCGESISNLSASYCDCGIDVEIIRPDGSIELPRYKLSSSYFGYSFTARESGVYVMYLNNTFRDTHRNVYIVIAGFPPPTTTTTVTRTVTVTYTATSIATTTVTALTTLTVEREWGSTATALSAAALAAAVIAIALALLPRRK